MLSWISARLPTPVEEQDEAHEFRLRPDGDVWILEETGREYVYRGTRSDVVVRFLERLNELACFTTPALTVHSGLVANESGVGIWIPAASGGGKSTLTGQLAMSGLRYATDEVVTVGEGGELTGWPKWLCLKRGSHEAMRHLTSPRGEPVGTGSRWMVPPRAVGVIADEPLVAGLVAFPRYRSGAATTMEEISKAEAVAEIVPQAFNLRRWGIAGVEALASAVRRSHSRVRITYGDGWDASKVLIDLLRTGTVTTSPATEGPVR